MIDDIPDEIVNLVIEYKTEQNDGFTKEGIRKQLVKIREFIDEALKED